MIHTGTFPVWELSSATAKATSPLRTLLARSSPAPPGWTPGRTPHYDPHAPGSSRLPAAGRGRPTVLAGRERRGPFRRRTTLWIILREPSEQRETGITIDTIHPVSLSRPDEEETE
ncbi:hypothetical protein GCM10023195_71040 [Actinoallomurus liliacearum]|uniref:Uncharacterized protein n=1 Tax=Actinoallomurus liliacearum TaxID=1080073 RepID=A0ABP8TXJ6_9ACTN